MIFLCFPSRPLGISAWRIARNLSRAEYGMGSRAKVLGLFCNVMQENERRMPSAVHCGRARGVCVL